MFAGQIAETLGWRWGFWMIVPVAVAAVIGCWLLAAAQRRSNSAARLDWLGFISLSAGIAAGQLVFSRGQRLDWFESGEIILATLLAGLTIYLFCVHSLTSERPFVRLKLLADRNYALGLILVTLFGMLNFAIIVLLPPLLQQHAGYPEVRHRRHRRRARAGLGNRLLCWRCRWHASIRASACRSGRLLQVITGFWLMSFDLNVDMTTLMLCNMLQGMSIGISWVPLTVITFWTLPPQFRAEAMSLFHLLPQFRLEPVHLDRRGRDRAYAGRQLRAHGGVCLALQSRPGDAVGHGRLGVDTAPGLAKLSSEIARQSILIGYTNAWVLYTLAAALAPAVPAGAAAEGARPKGLTRPCAAGRLKDQLNDPIGSPAPSDGLPRYDAIWRPAVLGSVVAKMNVRLAKHSRD